MRFILNQSGVGKERIGYLWPSSVMTSPYSVIETPTTALFTQAGSVVNITAEVLAKIFTNPKLLWVPLSNSLHLKNGLRAENRGVAKFAGLPGYYTCVTLHSMSEPTPQGHFEQDKVPVWTKNGKKYLTTERYMDLMEVFKPDIYMTIADGHTSLNEGKKRVEKSIERSRKSLHKCAELHKSSKILNNSCLIGVIVGTADMRQCYPFIQQLLTYKESLGGVTLQGITDGSEDSFTVKFENLEVIFKNIGEAIPNDLLRIVEGCWSVPVMLAAIEHGWDLFDGSYPVKLSNAGYALRLNFNIATSDKAPFFLNLNDVKYQDDFTPILSNCECLACKKHTRAYIRHLLNTREMLANVLLSIHNLHHFELFFHYVRRHIAEKTFQDFKEHITAQCNAHELVIPVPKVKENTHDERSLKKNKKKKIAIEVSNNDSVDAPSTSKADL